VGRSDHRRRRRRHQTFIEGIPGYLTNARNALSVVGDPLDRRYTIGLLRPLHKYVSLSSRYAVHLRNSNLIPLDSW
jgi:hypothetical protein